MENFWEATNGKGGKRKREEKKNGTSTAMCARAWWAKQCEKRERNEAMHEGVARAMQSITKRDKAEAEQRKKENIYSRSTLAVFPAGGASSSWRSLALARNTCVL